MVKQKSKLSRKTKVSQYMKIKRDKLKFSQLIDTSSQNQSVNEDGVEFFTSQLEELQRDIILEQGSTFSFSSNSKFKFLNNKSFEKLLYLNNIEKKLVIESVDLILKSVAEHEGRPKRF